MPQVNAPAVWGISMGSGVSVAVIDSGVAYEDCPFSTCGDAFAQADDLAGTSFASGYDFVSDDQAPLSPRS